jgi:hypothetical protein
MPRVEISGPQGIQATFDWQAARDGDRHSSEKKSLSIDVDVQSLDRLR